MKKVEVFTKKTRRLVCVMSITVRQYNELYPMSSFDAGKILSGKVRRKANGESVFLV